MCGIQHFSLGFSFTNKDFEEGASAAEAKSTQEHKPDFADLLSTSDLECSLCIRSVSRVAG